MADFNNAQVQQIIATDPQIKAWAAAFRKQYPIEAGVKYNLSSPIVQDGQKLQQQINSYLQSTYGVTVPSDYRTGSDVAGNADLVQDTPFYKDPWFWATVGLPVGGAVAGAALGGTGGMAAGDVGATTTVPEAGAIVEGGTAAGTGAAATTGGAAATGGEAAADGGVWAADGTFVGETLPTTGLATGGASTGILSSLAKYAPLIKDAGSAISAGAQAATNNRQTTAEDSLKSYDEFLKYASEEDKQRAQARRDAYAGNYYATGSHSPNDPTPPKVSANYMQTLSALEQQAMKRLMQDPQYGTNTIPPFKPGQPGSPGMPTDPGTLEQIGTWAGPLLKLGGDIWSTQ